MVVEIARSSSPVIGFVDRNGNAEVTSFFSARQAAAAATLQKWLQGLLRIGDIQSNFCREFSR